jgi:hypothetical protein
VDALDLAYDGDLVLDAEGRLALVRDDDLLRQRIHIALHTQRGDWPFDSSWGLPWRQRILVASPSLGEIASAIRAQLERIPGVFRVDDLSLELEGRTLRGSVRVNGVVEVGL